jgi:acetyl-CoA carboxylase alpha subunit
VATAPEVAGSLRLTARDMRDLGVVDGVISEGQAALDEAVAEALESAMPGERDRRFDAVTARWLEP